MKRIVTALFVLALAGTLVLSSSAVPVLNGGTDHVHEDILVSPHPGPNGDYAYLSGEDDELVVDLTDANPNITGEGINPNGTTHLSDVFTVHYNGSRYVHVWITHGSDDVTFRVEGQTIQSQAGNVTLEPGETVDVGLTVDTTGETTDGLVDHMIIHARIAEPEDATTEN